MGALAISALAASDLRVAFGYPLFAEVGLTLWAGASIWLAVLVFSELRWRRLEYEPRRWATVFPLGMYAAASHTVAQVTGIDALLDVSHLMLWVATSSWLLVAVSTLQHARGPLGRLRSQMTLDGSGRRPGR